MRLSKRFDVDRPDLICKVRKSIFGLLTAGVARYKLFQKTILKHNFRTVSHTECMYERVEGNITFLLICYVDDVLWASKCAGIMDRIKKDLKNVFQSLIWAKLIYFGN